MKILRFIELTNGKDVGERNGVVYALTCLQWSCRSDGSEMDFQRARVPLLKHTK